MEQPKAIYIKPAWSQGSTIFHKKDGSAYLVVHIYKNTCTVIVSLHDHATLPATHALLPKDYYKFTTEATPVRAGKVGAFNFTIL